MMEDVSGSSLELIIHPGETIKEVLLDRNMKQEELALRTGFSAKHVSEVISGKKNISSNFANSLEYALNIPMNFWMNLQGMYDKEIIELEKENSIDEGEFLVINDLKNIIDYCFSLGIIKNISNKSMLVMDMRRFLNVNNLLIIPKLPIYQVTFRGSKKTSVNINVLYAWEKICEYFTNKIITQNSFNPLILVSKYDEIKKTMFLEPDMMITKLKEIFLECGIIFDVVRHFPGAPVQGYIRKKGNNVVLCMTIRKSFSDIFWFTLFHEIAHIINNDFSDYFVDYTFIQSDIENRADDFAKNILINSNNYESFKSRGKYDASSIREFALSEGVLPGIVVGRIQNDINDYSFMTNLKERYKWVINN